MAGAGTEPRLLDLGCGACGPLTFIMNLSGCSGIGVDVSAEALAAGRRRANSLGVDRRLTLHAADLNGPIPVATGSVDAVIALDMILHLRDRILALKEIARVLAPAGKLLFSDSGVVRVSIDSEEVATRSMHGFTQFSAPGYNERMLQQSGFRLIESEDRTSGMLANARGRLAARLAHRVDLEPLEGTANFQRYQEYLQVVIAMSARGAVSPVMYLAQGE